MMARMVYEEGGELGPFLICVVYFFSVFTFLYTLTAPRRLIPDGGRVNPPVFL
jgi:hypothetical protein